MNKVISIRYFFAVCSIILCFSSTAKAMDHLNLQKGASVFIISAISRADLLPNERVNPLLNKVFVPSHLGDHTLFWKSVALTFQKTRKVYADLGKYLYASLCSIFRW
ncbi:hypothetical protein [Bartonella sp. B41]